MVEAADRGPGAALDFQEVEALRRNHPGFRLLLADSAPLVASFLWRTFLEPNLRSLPEDELTSRLDDQLFQLRELRGADAFPKGAADYLNDWAADSRGWLRKYYPPGGDEAHFDLTPAAEKAIDWLVSLRRRSFVGTESRLQTVFELLRQLAEGTRTEPAARLAELTRRRDELDLEIARVREGRLDVMEATQVKDRFQQMAETARGLLSDFREVEQNFRDLDRSVRERIALWEGGKGELLDRIFGERDAIADSDQGRSFRAFWDFLMSPSRQEELSALLEEVFALDAVRALGPDPRLRRVHFDWLEAGKVAQDGVARLSGELRRFLDDQVWLENRRISRLVQRIEQHAVALRDAPPSGDFMALDDPGPTLDLTMDRPLYSPPFRARLAEQLVVAGDGVLDDALFEQAHIDRLELASRVRRALQTQGQISLGALVERFPLAHGLADLLAYLSLASEDAAAVIDDGTSETVGWRDPTGRERRATLPLVVWSR
ncbi:MAG: DUF3375 domain-containing protein [Deltaproteobacteria bacterium]